MPATTSARVGAAVSPPAVCSRWLPRQSITGASRIVASQAARSRRSTTPPASAMSFGQQPGQSRRRRNRAGPAWASRSSVAARLPRREEARLALIGRHRRQAVRQIDARAFRVEPQHRGRGGDLEGRVPVLRQPALWRERSPARAARPPAAPSRTPPSAWHSLRPRRGCRRRAGRGCCGPPPPPAR